jgi:hypothetical protein
MNAVNNSKIATKSSEVELAAEIAKSSGGEVLREACIHV